jgi:hypothetical protein
MTTAPSQPRTGGVRPRGRVERRKAQTRQKLITAARAMLAIVPADVVGEALPRLRETAAVVVTAGVKPSFRAAGALRSG